jgi:hypothetical protein
MLLHDAVNGAVTGRDPLLGQSQRHALNAIIYVVLMFIQDVLDADQKPFAGSAFWMKALDCGKNQIH